MVKNKNGFKLTSALARGNWVIDSAYVHGNFPLVQSILKGTHVFADDEPKEDILVDPDFMETENEAVAQGDTFTGKIAVMNVTGPILHYGGACSYGSKDYAAKLYAYADDPSIAAGIMVGNTPGGQVDGIQTFSDAVDYFVSKKPLLGFVDDGMLASGGCWAFSGCTEIWASHATCQIGSYGAMAGLIDARKAMEDNGITQIIILAPQSPDKNKETRDALDGNTSLIEAELRVIAGTFLERITSTRASKLTSDKWNTGLMFFANEATSIGLIDGIKPFAEVVKRASLLAVQSQNQQSSNNNQIKNMGIFGSDFPAINAVGKLAADGITEAHIEAINVELAAKGVNNLVMISASHLAEANVTADLITSVLASANAALGDGKKTTLVEAVNSLISERNEAVKLAEEYGDQPGVLPTNPTSTAKAEGGETLENKQPFLTSVDAELAEYNKQVKI